MNTKILCRLTAGCLAAAALVAATIAPARCIRHARTTRPPARPTTSRRTSPRTAAFRGRPITATLSNTWARMRWPRSRTSRSTRCTSSMRGLRTSRRIAVTASSRTARSLVKEVTRVGSEKLTTGQSHWATDVKIWFVMIKDAKGRFPEQRPVGRRLGLGPVRGEGARRRTWRPTTRLTAGRATCRPRRTTGCTSADTRCLRNDGRNSNRRGLGSWPVSRNPNPC